jgi:hypothetical protein
VQALANLLAQMKNAEVASHEHARETACMLLETGLSLPTLNMAMTKQAILLHNSSKICHKFHQTGKKFACFAQQDGASLEFDANHVIPSQ